MEDNSAPKRRKAAARVKGSDVNRKPREISEEIANDNGSENFRSLGGPKEDGRRRSATREAPKDCAKDLGSESWIPEKEFEASLSHIPTTIPFQGDPRQGTLSVALPASIIANAQSLELKAALAGQVARALVIMGVDEVVIYEDDASAIDKSTGRSQALNFFVRNLQYLETPQFLRKLLFKLHPDLKFAGLQNPLDAPHHLRRTEWLPYREGVVLGESPKAGVGCLVECGLAFPVRCLQSIPAGTRVTLRLHPGMRTAGDGGRLSAAQREALFRGEAVSPQEPPTRAESGGLYDCLVGTSERGVPLGDVSETLQYRTYKHLLLVFGGLNGLEAVIRDAQADIPTAVARTAVRMCLNGEVNGKDSGLRRACKTLAHQGRPGGLLEPFMKGKSTELPLGTLFDVVINTCPMQTSRTIRAEEALLVTLAALRQAGIHLRGIPLEGATFEGKRRLHLPPLFEVMRAVESAAGEG